MTENYINRLETVSPSTAANPGENFIIAYEAPDTVNNDALGEEPVLYYCSLGYIVNTLINKEVLENSALGKGGTPAFNYYLDAKCIHETGTFSADPLNILFLGLHDCAKYTNATTGEDGIDFNEGVNGTRWKVFTGGSGNMDCSKILIGRHFLRNVMSDPTEGNKSIKAFLLEIFRAISASSGGLIKLRIVEGQTCRKIKNCK